MWFAREVAVAKKVTATGNSRVTCLELRRYRNTFGNLLFVRGDICVIYDFPDGHAVDMLSGYFEQASETPESVYDPSANNN